MRRPLGADPAVLSLLVSLSLSVKSEVMTVQVCVLEGA
jgi:hypothetical protein